MKDLTHSITGLQINNGEISIGATQSAESLQLGVESITDVNSFINNPVMPSPTGGGFDPNTAFTYSLSMGRVCRNSREFGAYKNAYECGWKEAKWRETHRMQQM